MNRFYFFMYCLVISSFLFGMQQDKGCGKKALKQSSNLAFKTRNDLDVERRRYNEKKQELSKKFEELSLDDVEKQELSKKFGKFSLDDVEQKKRKIDNDTNATCLDAHFDAK